MLQVNYIHIPDNLCLGGAPPRCTQIERGGERGEEEEKEGEEEEKEGEAPWRVPPLRDHSCHSLDNWRRGQLFLSTASAPGEKVSPGAERVEAA